MEAFLYYILGALAWMFFLGGMAAVGWAVYRVMMSRDKNLSLAVGPGLTAVVLLALWIASDTFGAAFVSVPAGNRAVIFSTSTGVSNRILGEGIHGIKPVFEHAQLVNVQNQVSETNTQTATKDQQTVTTHVKVWFHPEPDEVNKLYQELGADWGHKGLLEGHLAEILKQETVKYDAMSLLSSREQIALSAREQIKSRLRHYHIVVENLTIGDIQFTDSFNKAIEEKQVAEQAALKKRYDLQAARTQAEIDKAKAEGMAKSAIAEAKGQAESARIVSAAIAGNPNYMKLKELENRKDVADILAKSQNVIYLPSNSLVNIGGMPNGK